MFRELTNDARDESLADRDRDRGTRVPRLCFFNDAVGEEVTTFGHLRVNCERIAGLDTSRDDRSSRVRRRERFPDDEDEFFVRRLRQVRQRVRLTSTVQSIEHGRDRSHPPSGTDSR